MTNLGAPRNSWTLTFAFPGDQRVTSAWNATVSQTGTAVTARNGNLATGATVTFGLQATHSGTDNRPTDFQLDGTTCRAT